MILALLGLVFGIIDKVVWTMTHWNKVSPAFPYLVDVRFGVGEGLVRVWSVRFVGSLQILVAIMVVVFIKRSRHMAFFTVVCSIARSGIFNTLW